MSIDEKNLGQAMQALVEARKRANKTAVAIAHISDLHFTPDMTWPTGAATDVLEALAIDIAARRPDILAVTGDIADNHPKNATQEQLKKSFENARGFLLDLCSRCGIPPLAGLFVVPGNHDARISGNFTRDSINRVRRSWYLRCGLTFVSRALAQHLPADSQKYVRDIVSSGVDQALEANQESDLAVFREIFGRYCESRPLEPLGLYVFCIDSNNEHDALLNFARGLVTLKQINSFQKQAEEWKRKFKGHYECGFKIALLHHHPMPIPDTETGKDWEDESFVLLKNAGTLLKTLIENEIDFVLHGHQHCPGYSKAEYPAGGDETRAIAILGAGSVLQPYQDRYSYNMLTWEEGGGWKTRRRVKMLGQAGYAKRDETTFALLTSRQRHERMYKSLLEARQVQAAITDASIDITIDSSGDVDRHIQWRQIRPPAAKAALDSISFFVEAESNVVYYSYKSAPGYVTAENASQQKNKLDLVFKFARPSTDETPQDLDFHVNGENAYLFSQDYCKKYKVYNRQPQDFENFRFTISKAYEHLKMRIQFPPGLPPLEPELRVFTNEKEDERDPDEERYLENNWRYYPDPRRPTIFFSVDRPLPGYVYMLRWNLPETEFDLVPQGDRAYIRSVVEAIRASVRQAMPAENTEKLTQALEKLLVDMVGQPQQQIGIDIAFEQEAAEDIHEQVTRLPILVSRQRSQRSADWKDGPERRPQSRLGEDIRGGSYLSKSFMAATAGNQQRIPKEELGIQWQFAYPVLYPPEAGARLAVISVWSRDPNSVLRSIIPQAGKPVPMGLGQVVTRISQFAYELGDALGTPLDKDL